MNLDTITTTKQEGIVRYDRPIDKVGWRNCSNWYIRVSLGWRSAELLAVNGPRFLFEYKMPNGKKYWYEVSVNERLVFDVILSRPVSKSKRLPMRWRHAAEWLVDKNEYLTEKTRWY